jgi:hypothetical protein
MTERERPATDASELEGGGTEQTWGQGEGRHEPTIPDEASATGGGGRTQGETVGPEQEPTEVGDQDPANRDPRPDGPMTQPVDHEDPDNPAS